MPITEMFVHFIIPEPPNGWNNTTRLMCRPNVQIWPAGINKNVENYSQLSKSYMIQLNNIHSSQPDSTRLSNQPVINPASK